MLYWLLPGKTEAGPAGEQPAEGYPGQAHQTMRRWGVTMAPRLLDSSSDDRPDMPQKRKTESGNQQGIRGHNEHKTVP